MEDLHWADEASLDLLAPVGRRIEWQKRGWPGRMSRPGHCPRGRL